MELTDDVHTRLVVHDHFGLGCIPATFLRSHHEEGRVAAYGEVGKGTSASGTLGVGPPQYCLPSASRPYDGPGLKRAAKKDGCVWQWSLPTTCVTIDTRLLAHKHFGLEGSGDIFT